MRFSRAGSRLSADVPNLDLVEAGQRLCYRMEESSAPYFLW